MKKPHRAVRFFLIFDLKVIKMFLEFILRRKAGVDEKTAFARPLGETAVVKHFEFLVNDKGNYVVTQTFFEENQSTDTPVTVLKRMDAFKSVMKVKNILESLFLGRIV